MNMKEKDFRPMYIKLGVLAWLGVLVCWYFGALDALKWYDYICYAYIIGFFGFFRLNIDNVDEKRFFGIACWIAFLTIDIALLCGINMWYHPLIATLAVSFYFLLRSYIFAKELDVESMVNSAIASLIFNYVLMALIKVVAVKLYYHFFG